MLLAWSGVLCGICLGRGAWTATGLACLLAAAVCTVAGVTLRTDPLPVLLPAGLVTAAAVLVVGGVVWRPHFFAHGSWQVVSGWAAVLATLAAAGAALVAARAALRPRWGPAARLDAGAGPGPGTGADAGAREGAAGTRRAEAAWWALALTLAAAAGVTVVVAAPHPHIDVWFLLQDSTRGILEGKDMYRQVWPGSTGLYAVYPYLPGTSLLLLPSRALFGDIRYAEVAALVVAALALRSLALSRLRAADRGLPAPAGPPHRWSGPLGRLPGRVERRATLAAEAALVPLLVIAFPEMTYSIQLAWTEPLLVAALALTVLAVERDRPGWAVVALAAALASKQHVWLLLPLAAAWPAFGWRRTLRSVGLALLVIAPWLVAGPADLWHDAVSVNLGYPVLERSLSLPALAARAGVTVGFLPGALALLAAYALCLWRLPRTSAGFAAGSALVILVLDLVNKQSFFNHYTLAAGLLALAVVAPSGRAVRASAREEP